MHSWAALRGIRPAVVAGFDTHLVGFAIFGLCGSDVFGRRLIMPVVPDESTATDQVFDRKNSDLFGENEGGSATWERLKVGCNPQTFVHFILAIS